MSRFSPRTIASAVPALFLVTLVLMSCNDEEFLQPELKEIGPFDTTQAVTRFKTDTGLAIYIYEEGTGRTVSENDELSLRYTGRRTNGTIFDSSARDDQDDPVFLNIRTTVSGFRHGLSGVIVDGERRYAAREGGTRTLVIPPHLGYAGTGSALRNDTLIFDIDVLQITSPR